MMELVDVVFIQTFEFDGPKMLGQVIELAHLEQREYPLVQD